MITIMFLMLTASFIVIFILSDVSARALAKYPLVADCSLLAGADDEHKFLQNTVLEYHSNHSLEEQGFHVSYSKGYVVCFCADRMEEGDEPDKIYGPYEEPISEDYVASLTSTELITNGIMVTIVGINLILKYSIIALITWIGYDTHSELMTKITNGVFIGLFFNTGILLTLSNANLSDVSDPLALVFDKTFYDYSP